MVRWIQSGDSALMNGHLMTLVHIIAENLKCGRLTIIAPDGDVRHFEGGVDGPDAVLQLNSLRAIRRFMAGGSLGFAEAYLDGDWDSPDLPRLLELLVLNNDAYLDHFYGRGWFRWLARLRHLFRPNSIRGSRRNILAHYDLGNRFYQHWLDPSMTYSSARFERPDASLEDAQTAKYASLANKLALHEGHHLLEVGCGWGGFAEFAAREVGAKVTAITISDQQHAFAAERIQSAGLSEKVEIRLQDYRDVDGRFDRVASIEMFEAVGESYWPVYFDKLAGIVQPGGVVGLQVITIADHYYETYRRGADFIQRHVFPGGMLPSPAALQQQWEGAGLQKLSETTFGLDYAKTLAIWNRRFQAAWPELLQLGYDQRFKRLWQYYLAYCEAGFKAGWTDVCQIALRRA
ncbi:MAG: cyclopropane-fatty-acyl-phospholipid synthase family protein [Alphaproteobacteria bacterium]|nr:cyclopropane-fatty-acyl-phospholipid synthase family protein [Alphaproteobacteria bacterium]